MTIQAVSGSNNTIAVNRLVKVKVGGCVKYKSATISSNWLLTPLSLMSVMCF